ncbi:MAG: HD domain-containing protein [Gammaproteobacteria bacterium]
METRTPLSLIVRALAFAADKHRDQRRKDTQASPYINHPIDLVNVLCNEAGITDETVLCGAILHDTVEDTETTLEELEAQFGPTIAGIVEEVTDDQRLTKAERKQRQIDRAGGASRAARLVKLADKICNLRDMDSAPPAGWDSPRRREYFDWAKAVVDQIRGTHPDLEALFDRAYARRPD